MIKIRLPKVKLTKREGSLIRKPCRLTIFVSIALLANVCLVVVALILYNSSGAAQLDLSRPGYIDVRDQVSTEELEIVNYSSNGRINQQTIAEFKKLLSEQADKVKASGAFAGDPLDETALGLDVATDE
jgi:hypothetical protein